MGAVELCISVAQKETTINFYKTRDEAVDEWYGPTEYYIAQVSIKIFLKRNLTDVGMNQ